MMRSTGFNTGLADGDLNHLANGWLIWWESVAQAPRSPRWAST